MDDWFQSISAGTELSYDSLHALESDGFLVMTGPAPAARLPELDRCYDEAISGAAPDDIEIGSTTTRVSDFLNRNVQFDDLYVYPPILEACCRIIEQPFKLSTMHARIDPFTMENGATCLYRVPKAWERHLPLRNSFPRADPRAQ